MRRQLWQYVRPTLSPFSFHSFHFFNVSNRTHFLIQLPASEDWQQTRPIKAFVRCPQSEIELKGEEVSEWSVFCEFSFMVRCRQWPGNGNSICQSPKVYKKAIESGHKGATICWHDCSSNGSMWWIIWRERPLRGREKSNNWRQIKNRKGYLVAELGFLLFVFKHNITCSLTNNKIKPNRVLLAMIL